MQSRAEDGILARGEREGALAAEIWQLDHPTCEKRPRNADHAQDDLLYALGVSEEAYRETKTVDSHYGR